LSQELAWNGVHALVAPAPADARDAAAASAATHAAAVSVEYVTGARLAALAEDWSDLARRADAANVFMHPSLLSEAASAYPEREIGALAGFANGRLAGLWGFAHTGAHQSPLPLTVLAAPPAPNARAQRPKLSSDLDPKAYFEQAMSASSRKKLRQHRRRLGEKGVLASVVVTEPHAVGRAFEDFLSLEAAGWKGRQGTALANNAADAQYTRAMIAALAAQGDAEVHSLTLDGRPVSMQMLLRAGRTAFTWKTCYDESLHDVSPGTLLFEDYTAHLLADERVDAVDSCSFDDSGYMGSWQERSEIATLWFDARPRRSMTFLVFAQMQSTWLALRARAKTLYRKHLRKTGR